MNWFEWVAAIATGWFTASLLVAAGFALLRRVTRTNTDRLHEEIADLTAVLDATTGRAEDELLDSIHRAYVAEAPAEERRQAMKAVAGSDIKPGMWIVTEPGLQSIEVARIEPCVAAPTWVRVVSSVGFAYVLQKNAFYAEVEFG